MQYKLELFQFEIKNLTLLFYGNFLNFTQTTEYRKLTDNIKLTLIHTHKQAKKKKQFKYQKKKLFRQM